LAAESICTSRQTPRSRDTSHFTVIEHLCEDLANHFLCTCTVCTPYAVMECCHECVVMAFPIVDIVRLISAQVSKSWLIAPGAALVWHAVDDWCPPKDLEQPVWLPATETYQSTSISPISRLVAKRIPSKYPMIRQSHVAFSPHCDAMWRRGLSNSADPLVFLLLVVSNSYLRTNTQLPATEVVSCKLQHRL